MKIPFYAKFALISIGLFAFVYTLYIGQHIILPIVYATILAILLNPFVNFLVNKKVNRTFAISVSVLIAICILIFLIYFLSVQITLFSDTYPKLSAKFSATTQSLIQWTSVHLNIGIIDIEDWIKKVESEAVNNIGGAIGNTLATINSTIIIVFILPVYLFMILFYKDLLLEFIRRLFSTTYHIAIFEILGNSKKIIQNYLIGLLLEAAIIATLNSIGLLCLGIDYAIILGITGALLNVIPYIGGVIAIALPMLIAYVTKDSSTYALLVLLMYLLIQFIDNHFIIPRIVASKVKINALISIVVVLVGSALWGVPGMFLSIPLTAIIKVVFDNIEPLKPWGFLLGNIVPTTQRIKFNFIKNRNKAS